MIDAPRVGVETDVGRLNGVDDAPRDLRIARCGVLHVKERLWKAIEIVDRTGRAHRGDRGDVDVPVSRDDEHRRGLGDGRAKVGPTLGVAVLFDGVHRAAVSDERRWHQLRHAHLALALSVAVRVCKRAGLA